MAIVSETHDDTEKSVDVLLSKIIQIQVASHPGDFNCGPHVQLFVLCEDGSVWCKYESSGDSNVPCDGRWHNRAKATTTP